MATRFLTATNVTRQLTLDNGVLDELRADFGPVAPLTIARAQAIIADPNQRAIGYFTGGGQGTLRGFMLARLNAEGWEIWRIVTEKALTAAQRITGARDAIRFGAEMVALTTPNATIYGIVKAGGRLDLLLQPKGYTRTVVDRDVIYTPAVGEPPGGLPAGDEEPTSGVTTYVEKLVRYSATASVVAATI